MTRNVEKEIKDKRVRERRRKSEETRNVEYRKIWGTSDGHLPASHSTNAYFYTSSE